MAIRILCQVECGRGNESPPGIPSTDVTSDKPVQHFWYDSEALNGDGRHLWMRLLANQDGPCAELGCLHECRRNIIDDDGVAGRDVRCGEDALVVVRPLFERIDQIRTV